MNANDPNSSATSDRQRSLFDSSEPAAEQSANPRPLAKAKGRPVSPKSPQSPVIAVERPIWDVRLPFLGPPPLVLGEDPDNYYELRARLRAGGFEVSSRKAVSASGSSFRWAAPDPGVR